MATTRYHLGKTFAVVLVVLGIIPATTTTTSIPPPPPPTTTTISAAFSLEFMIGDEASEKGRKQLILAVVVATVAMVATK
jgi:hypothetical protein